VGTGKSGLHLYKGVSYGAPIRSVWDVDAVTAAFTDTNTSVVFQGVIPVPIGLWLNGYTPSNSGWLFGSSPWPIEFTGRRVTATQAFLGVKGSIFDPVNFATSFSLGTVAGGTIANNINVIYDNGQLRGFYQNANIPNTPTVFSYGITKGIPLVNPVWSGVEFGAITGSRVPGNGFKDGCQLGAGHVIYSEYDKTTLVESPLLVFNPDNSVNGSYPGGFEFPLRGAFPTDLQQLCVSPTGQNWATVGGSGSSGRVFASCDFSAPGFLGFKIATWDIPAVDAIMQTEIHSDKTRPTPFGWLSCIGGASQPVTIGGITYTSYMILTSADGSKYWLLNILPQDAFGANWQNSIGTTNAVMFPSGQMLIHRNNVTQDAIILTSLVLNSIFKMLPVFPPVSLPNPPPDTEIPLTLFREENAKT